MESPFGCTIVSNAWLAFNGVHKRQFNTRIKRQKGSDITILK
jgi:hypothetical protein